MYWLPKFTIIWNCVVVNKKSAPVELIFYSILTVHLVDQFKYSSSINLSMLRSNIGTEKINLGSFKPPFIFIERSIKASSSSFVNSAKALYIEISALNFSKEILFFLEEISFEFHFFSIPNKSILIDA